MPVINCDMDVLTDYAC